MDFFALQNLVGKLVMARYDEQIYHQEGNINGLLFGDRKLFDLPGNSRKKVTTARKQVAIRQVLKF